MRGDAAARPPAAGSPGGTAGGLAAPSGPDADVLAVIAAAVDAAWPRPVAAAAAEPEPAHRSWRFSGRWWNKPIPVGRERPSSRS